MRSTIDDYGSNSDMKDEASRYFREIQSQICSGLETLDAQALFQNDTWEREDSGGGYGGGGLTRVIEDGRVFEKGGVNFSEVSGTLPLAMSKRLTNEQQEQPFFATGVSLVLHPFSPMVPTVHANFRYLEVGDRRWFGGGADLTPYYLFEEDAVHFHKTLKEACDTFDHSYYPRFKAECDKYFYLPHREEARGIGGIFFDYLGKSDPENLAQYQEFTFGVARAFLPSYLPIVERRQELAWGEAEKRFQLLRRGRYVEFNLIHDRGTQFGLHTGGRTESILMSLPAQVSWKYGFEPEPNTREQDLLAVLREPRDWV